MKNTKGLKKILVGAALIGVTLLGYSQTNYAESSRNKDLDRKAQYIIPDKVGINSSGKYKVDGKDVKVYTSVVNFSYPSLDIKVNNEVNFKSQRFLYSNEDGDARNLSEVSIYAGGKWEPVENPEKFQGVYEELIEKVYDTRKGMIDKTKNNMLENLQVEQKLGER